MKRLISLFMLLVVVALAIAAGRNGEFQKEPVTPCGACRQVMLEVQHRFKKPIRVILDSSNKIEVLDNINGLLPLSFNGNSLKSIV